MATFEDVCLFCVEKIIPYTVPSNLEREGRFGSDITPPPPPSFKKLCDILQIDITSDLLKGLKSPPSFLDTIDADSDRHGQDGGGGGGESCKKFLCLTCFEDVEKLSKLHQELEIMKKKIENETRSIRDLIIGKTGVGLAKKKGRNKKKSCSLEFIEAFQKLVKEGIGSNALETPPSATPPGSHGKEEGFVLVTTTVTSKPTKRQSSRKKRPILVQADEDDHENDDDSTEASKVDVKLEVYQEDDFDDFSDYLPNTTTTTGNYEFKSISEEGKDSVTQGASGTQMQIEVNECEFEIEQKFVPPTEDKTVKKRGRKRKDAEPRSPPKKKRKRVNGQGGEFKCGYCSATFQSSFKYYTHRKSHAPPSTKSLDITTIYKAGTEKQVIGRVCPVCNQTIGRNLRYFMEHTLSHEITEENPIHPCDECDKKFFIKLNLDLHKICEHNLRHFVLKCDICQDSSQKTRDGLIAHYKTHKEDTSIHLCKSCPMACTTLDNLLSHMKKHSNSKRLICPECDHFVSPTLSELYSHCRKVHAELKQIFECELCRKPFHVPATLRQHMRECHGDAVGDFMCDQCSNGKLYKTKAQLQRHIEYMHGDEMKPFKCDKCPKSFRYKFQLQQHIEEKHDKVRHPCPICAKTYSTQIQVNYHLRTHTGEDLFTCDVCGKQFPRMTQLKIHSAVHSDKTDEVCDICGKAFGNSMRLRKHKIIHKEKSLECNNCGMKFGRRDHFRNHLRIHTGERPFVCPICQKGFNRKDIMIVHMGMHGFSKDEAYKQYDEENGLN